MYTFDDLQAVVLNRMREVASCRYEEPSICAVRSALEPHSSVQEDHPTERELQGLREWVLTQQWLQQHVAGIPGIRMPGGGQQSMAAVEQQALQLLRQAQQDVLRPSR